ncbi:hypothetical protein BOX15_Mlig010556g3, partial [Macrostomum lignano]
AAQSEQFSSFTRTANQPARGHALPLTQFLTMPSEARGDSRPRRRHRHRRHSSSRDRRRSDNRSNSRRKAFNAVSGTTATAKELVASFKTMTLSKSMLQHPPPPLPPIPATRSAAYPAATTTLDDEDDENAFTLLDCMSIVLGGGDSLDKRRSQRQRGLNLQDAMNTVSSRSSSSSRDHRSHRATRHRHCRRCQEHHLRRHEQRQRHQRRASPAAGDAAAAATVAVDPDADAAAWQKRQPLPLAARRSCFGGFERIDNPISVEEAAPLATPQPLAERAREAVQPPGAACWLFRCAELPLLPHTAASVRLPPTPPPLHSPASPMSTSVTGTTASEQRRHRRHHRHCRHRCRRTLDDNGDCDGNGDGDLRDRQRHRSRRRRSLRQLEGGVGDEIAAASYDDSIIDISASTLAIDVGRSVAAAPSRRHLLEPPMPPSHRVRVPAGATSGQPPPKPPTAAAAATAAAANAALVYGGRLTRKAARTARSVSRQLRRAMCGRHAETEDLEGRQAPVESQLCDQLKQLQRQQQQQHEVQSELPAASCQLSNANANNDKAEAGGRCRCSDDDDEDFSSLLRTLDRARRRQRRHSANQSEVHAAPAHFEFFVRAGESLTSSASPSSRSFVSEDSQTQQQQMPPPPPPSRGSRRPHGNLSRKIELINSMAESLLGLSQSLKGCVGNINKSLGLMCEPE